MARAVLAVLAGVLFVFLAGCGGGGSGDGGEVIPPPGGGGSDTVQVGPLLVRPASAAGFVTQEIPNPNGPVSLAALHGSRITYLASQAFLDRVVYSREDGASDYDIWVCNLDGSNAMRLLNNPYIDHFPAWSPDGRQIALARLPAGQDNEIVVMNADGSGPHALTNDAANDIHPTWSPNGDSIAFHSLRTGNAEIFTMYADGNAQTNRTQNAAPDFEPDWSPNANDPFICFVTTRDAANYELYRMGPAGESQTRLTQTPEYEGFPACGPGGAEIAPALRRGAAGRDDAGGGRLRAGRTHPRR